MSVLSERAAVAYQFAGQESDAEFRAWLAAHSDAVDADGNQVICMFGPDEAAEQMMIEVLAYPHPVIIASVVDGNLSAVQLSDSVGPSAPHRSTIRIDRQTVAELIRAFMMAADRGDGRVDGVQVEFSLAGARHLVLT